MLLRLYAWPMLSLLVSALLSLYCGYPKEATRQPLATINQMLDTWACYGAALLLLLCVVGAIYASYRLWRWQRGEEEVCYTCGGIVNLLHGRWGYYYKCLACGNTQSAK